MRMEYQRTRLKMASKNERPAQPIRMVIADVDGTLVTAERALTQRAADAVLRLREAGIQVSVTSGRPPRGMAMLIDPLKLTQPLAAFNGGVLIKPDLTTVVDQKFLPAGGAGKGVEGIANHGLGGWLYTEPRRVSRGPDAAPLAPRHGNPQFPPPPVETFAG